MIEPTESLEEIDCLVEAYVEERRDGRCSSMEEFILRHPQWGSQLRDVLPAVAVLERSAQTTIAAPHGSLPSIPNYRFGRELGRGGMGIVFQAEHVALGRQVAVKILSSNLIQDVKAQERFQREARALARMHHSNIVPIFEAGRCNETSFYSMQLIVGKNLDQKIQELTDNNPNKRTHAQLLQHYRHVVEHGIRIARALHYAHQRNVLHRDIKPSNILVDGNNIAWLSDFGLASIAEERTALSEQIVGTLRYIAPERLQGKCDARSDIYSLGLTLYEYITLSPALGSMQRAELVSPDRKILDIAKLEPTVPNDLATIIDKSIRHEPELRYESAEAMAADLQNFLHGNPISARPVSLPERLWMWSKRNPVVATLAFSLNAILLAAAIASTLIAAKLQRLNQTANRAKLEAITAQDLAQTHAMEAEQQAVIAAMNERMAKRVSSYFARMIQGADPSGLFTGHDRSHFPVDKSTTAFEWIAQSAKMLESEDLTGAPLVEAELKDTLGVALTGQMRMADAGPLLNRAHEIRSQVLDGDHPDIAKSLDHLGTFHFYAGDPQAACDYFQRSLDIHNRRLVRMASESMKSEAAKDARLARARSQSALGLALEYSARHPNLTANDLLHESLATRIEILGADHEEVAYCHIALASVLARQVNSQEAMDEIVLAEIILTKSKSDHRLSEVFSLYAQGTALQAARMTDLAVDRFARAETLMTELFGPTHPLTVYARGEVAGALERGGYPEKAEAIHKRVIDFNEQSMAKQPFLGQSWDTLGICYRGQNKIAEASDAFENALRVYHEAKLSDEHILVAMTKTRLADCLVISGRIDEAYEMLKSATDALESIPKEFVDIELAKAFSYRSYLALWHQIDKYPEVVADVVRVGKVEMDPRVIEHLMNAGTRGHCTPEQAGILLEMNDRWLALAKDEYSQMEASHFRGRIFWQLGKYDEAIELLQGVQRCERRRYQADLFISLCWKAKGGIAKAESLYLTAVNSIIPRLPVHFAIALRDRTTDGITAKPPEVDPETPIEFPWEQTAYGEFAWRLLHE